MSTEPEAALALAPLVRAFRSLHIRMGEGSLDLAYMHRWASGLGIADLLKKALAEAGPSV